MRLFKVYFDCSCILLQCHNKEDIGSILCDFDPVFIVENGKIIFECDDVKQEVVIEEVTSDEPKILLAEFH